MLEALNMTTELFKNTDEHVKKVKFNADKKKEINGMMVSILLGSLTKTLIQDLGEDGCKGAFEDKGIRGYHLGLSINLATMEGSYLQLNIPTTTMLMKVEKGKSIKAGQLISAANLELYLEQARIKHNLGLREDAIKDYDHVIKESKDQKLRTAAWNNKGLIFMQEKSHKEAENCFQKALSEDKNCKQAQENLKTTQIALGNTKEKKTR